MNDDRHTPAMPNLGEGEWLDPQTCKQWKDYSGLTKAEYAAIHTGQPCSGTPWLDEMLAKARRERLAAQALASMTIAPDYSKGPCNAAMIERAFILADLAVVALEGGAK